MIRPDSCFRHHSDIAWRLVQEDALLVDPRSGKIFPLNPVAARIWVLLAEGLCVSDIIKSLSNEFDAPPDTIEKDTLEFIAKLLKENLLEEVFGTNA